MNVVALGRYEQFGLPSFFAEHQYVSYAVEFLRHFPGEFGKICPAFFVVLIVDEEFNFRYFAVELSKEESGPAIVFFLIYGCSN